MTIFYSWQSDLPNATNRGFIESALENAIRGLKREGDVHIDVAIDRDTEGVSGAPDIAETILAKIDRAQVFLADVSLINYEAGNDNKLRSTPNPNVLVELGYARRALGPSRLLLVHNKAYGPVEHLPFDLRGCRVITYSVETNEEDKSVPRKELESRLRVELRKIFDDILRYGLSDDAIQIGKDIARTSEDGLCEEGFMTVEEVSEFCGVSLERIEEPLKELQSEGLVDIEGVISSFKDHIIRPRIQLFVRLRHLPSTSSGALILPMNCHQTSTLGNPGTVPG